MKIISIIGSGGHTRSSINLLKIYFKSYELRIFDDNYNLWTEEFIHDIKPFGKIESLNKESLVFLSIGDNKRRKFFFEKYHNQVIKQNLIHEKSIVEPFVFIDKSNQIFANVYINSYVKIGTNNIINTGAIIEHEVIIGNHNHISVGSRLCGRVKIGNNCTIGAGATIIDKVEICDNVVLGAGAVLTNDLFESGVYVGVPAKKIK